MSGEVLRDPRKDRAPGPPRVRGPLRDRLPTEPEPDPYDGDKRRGSGWRIAATILLAAILAGVGFLIARQPPAPDCAALHRQAKYTSDAAILVEEAGCTPDPATTGHDLTARP